MIYDPSNPIVALCARGMMLEGEGKPLEAFELFQQAWSEATNDFEKSTAAHYVARHQHTADNKLHWDLISLQHALAIPDPALQQSLPSLYLNVAKCYEDLHQKEKAFENYRLAADFVNVLPADGYRQMISAGIEKGIQRVTS